jgi:hypothetical protein
MNCLRRWSLLSALGMLSASAVHAQATAPSYADMRTWELEGVGGGIWRDPANLATPFTNAISGRSVIQTFNNTAGTMFLLSNDTNVINRTIWGTVRIKAKHVDGNGVCAPTNCANSEQDNDWMGFVVGYVNQGAPANAFPESYLGFTWNRTLETGNPAPATSPYAIRSGGSDAEGIWLIRAAPPDAEGDPVGGGATIIDSDIGANTGWSYDTDYQFRIVYTTTRIRVYINDVLRLEASTPANSPFPAGQFGFTNASQANVLFGNVREAPASALDAAPVASDDQFYYGLTWGTEGTTFDTDLDPRAVGILDNDYDPDGDAFALRVNGVSLPNDGDSTTVTGTQGGSFRVYGSGRFVYTAPLDYNTRGPFQDTFAYTIVDTDGENSATVTLTVQQSNTAPNDVSLTDSDTGSTSDIRVDQGAEPGTSVGTIATIETNPSELDEYDYELQNASNGAFTLVGDQLIVRDTAALGGPGTHTIIVRSTDVEGQWVTRSFQIHVDANGVPTSANNAVNANAAVPYVFTVANFPFTDADVGDQLQKVLITSFPAHGALFIDFDGDNLADSNEIPQINFNDVITRAQITGGQLKYLSSSTTDTSTSFGFKVNDGAANSASAYTMTVNVESDTDNDTIPNTTDGTGDTDNDGTPNYQDTDSDGDGIPDATEGSGDTDSDGIPNHRDTDSDGDGIPDTTEGTTDSDGDGTPDYRDTDSDGDGVPDSTEGTGDADGDGTPDYRDTDSDGDGVPDSTEGAADTDGDGIPDFRDSDGDGDGIPDLTEGTGDTDNDGIPNDRDTDSDGDGVLDLNEGTGDTDGDGIPNFRDTDSDNDGRTDGAEGTGDTDNDGIPNYLDDSTDTDRDGIPDILEGTLDSDGDGLPNFRDTDSDDDGVPDVLEIVGARTDTDGDGIADRFDVTQTGGVDANSDGIDDAALPDSDNDGRHDVIDPDQDDDGIPDFIESGAYGFDSDNDGIDDRWDANLPGATDPDGDGVANNVGPVDTDADGIADLRDLDSDRDGISDAAESGASGVDSDADGLDNAFDVDVTGGADADGNGIADNVRARDTDQDGVPDFRDLDSDNDSLSDVREALGLDSNADALLDAGGTITSTPVDSDGDGTPDFRDVDANGDGVRDIAATSYAAHDANNDGRIDTLGNDVDGDGIADAIDGEPGQRGTRTDNDGDGVPAARDADDDADGVPDSLEGDGDTDGDGTIDRLDQDSDNDGIPDRIELGLPQASGNDTDLDGIDDAHESLVSRDTDGDGINDAVDTDSDNDGLSDAFEVLLVAPSGIDADGDGIDDSIDVDFTNGTDANRDGVDDAAVRIVDTDGDGLPDYRDSDSDGDGIADGKENGDFNNDGINDRLQKETGLKTGLKGGGGSLGVWSLLFMLALGCARLLRSKRRALLAASAVIASTFSFAQAADTSSVACTTGESFSEGCWSVGLGAYKTKLAPDDSQSTWRVVDTSDAGYKLTVEYRFFSRWSVEFGYADMGSAIVVNRNPSIAGREPVEYKVPSLLGGYLLFDPARRINVQVKAGYARLDTTAEFDIIDEQIKSHQLTLGAALRARIVKHLELQLEYEHYDKDARQAGLAVRYAF